MAPSLKERLESIDPVLNEPLARKLNEDDRANGFTTDLTKLAVKDKLGIRFHGLEAIQVAEKPGKYLFIQLALKKNPLETYLLRGFEGLGSRSANVGLRFLSELQEAVGARPFIPQSFLQGRQKEPGYGSINIFHWGEQLSVRVLGGGRYTFNRGQIDIEGFSADFGGVPQEKEEQARALISELPKRAPFSHYAIGRVKFDRF